MEKIYSLVQVAEYLQASRITLYNYIKSGKLKAFKVGGNWRATESDLEAFINANRNTAAEDDK